MVVIKECVGLSNTILVVEDERKIARLLQIELESEGYHVKVAGDGLTGLELYREGDIDLLILDVMMPGMSGIELLRRVRTVDEYTPVILLTAKSSIEDKVSGLDLGASDYMTKPFEIEELLARIRAALRISLKAIPVPVQTEQWFEVADLRLNEMTREVYRGEQLIQLTQKEFDLLAYLMRNEKIVLNREQILTEVWGYDFAGDTNIVDVYIRYVRKKVDASFDKPLIHTVRGIGYVIREQTP